MASSVVFMALVVATFFIDSYLQNKNPLNKLTYVGTVVHYDLIPGIVNRKQKLATKSLNPQSEQQRALDKTQIGIMIRNDAKFPISAMLFDAQTTMDELPPISLDTVLSREEGAGEWL